MKSILILLLILPLSVFSQEKLSFSEAIEVTGDKNELFIRGREWFNENFKSAKDVLQIADKESGELAGKGIMSVVYVFKYMGERSYTADVSFQMNVWVKDGKYKYEMTNFMILGTNGNVDFGLITTSDETTKTTPGYSDKKMNEMYLSIKKGTEIKSQTVIQDLKQKMSKTSKSAEW
jgi:hypothetical protein